MIARHVALPVTFALALGAADPSTKRLLEADTHDLLQGGTLKELLSSPEHEPQAKTIEPERLAQSCRNNLWRRC